MVEVEAWRGFWKRGKELGDVEMLAISPGRVRGVFSQCTRMVFALIKQPIWKNQQLTVR